MANIWENITTLFFGFETIRRTLDVQNKIYKEILLHYNFSDVVLNSIEFILKNIKITLYSNTKGVIE